MSKKQTRDGAKKNKNKKKREVALDNPEFIHAEEICEREPQGSGSNPESTDQRPAVGSSPIDTQEVSLSRLLHPGRLGADSTSPAAPTPAHPRSAGNTYSAVRPGAQDSESQAALAAGTNPSSGPLIVSGDCGVLPEDNPEVFASVGRGDMRTKYSAWLLTGFVVNKTERMNGAALQRHLLEHFSGIRVRCWSWAMQLERAPTTGNIHMQAFIELKQEMRFTALRKYLKEAYPGFNFYLRHISAASLGSAHVQRMRAWRYCQKESKRIEKVECIVSPHPPGKVGQPKKLKSATERTRTDALLKFGKRIAGRGLTGDKLQRFNTAKDVSEDDMWLVRTFFNHRDACERILASESRLAAAGGATKAAAERPPEVYYIYGDTGTSKTLRAQISSQGTAYFVSPGNMFYEGFDPDRHRVLVFDECENRLQTPAGMKAWFTLVSTNKPLLPVKNNPDHQAFITRVILLSNFEPAHICRRLDEITREAFFRRLSVCISLWRNQETGFLTGFHKENPRIVSVQSVQDGICSVARGKKLTARERVLVNLAVSRLEMDPTLEEKVLLEEYIAELNRPRTLERDGEALGHGRFLFSLPHSEMFSELFNAAASIGHVLCSRNILKTMHKSLKSEGHDDEETILRLYEFSRKHNQVEVLSDPAERQARADGILTMEHEIATYNANNANSNNANSNNNNSINANSNNNNSTHTQNVVVNNITFCVGDPSDIFYERVMTKPEFAAKWRDVEGKCRENRENTQWKD